MNKLPLLLLLLIPMLAWGQATQSVPPKPPFVLNAPGNCAWTIKFKPLAKPRPTPPQAGVGGPAPTVAVSPTVKEIQVTKIGTTHRVLYSWSDGAKTEKWWIAGIHLYKLPGNPSVYFVNPASTGQWTALLMPEDYGSRDFPELEWVSAATFTNELTYNERPCNLFQRKLDAASGEAAGTTRQPKLKDKRDESLRALHLSFLHRRRGMGSQAWIDAKTKLPIALNDGDNLRIYTFDMNPQPEPQLPPDFAVELQKFKDSNADVSKYQMKVD